MCKIIEIYNQTFIKFDETTSKLRCKFQRVYKHNPEQFFILKASVSRLDTDCSGGLIFVEYLPIVNMRCNYTDDEFRENNGWYLGSLADAGNIYEMKIDDIPLDGFKIYNSKNNNNFVVNFQIELRED